MAQADTVERLVTIAQAELLRSGGVDNWERLQRQPWGTPCIRGLPEGAGVAVDIRTWQNRQDTSAAAPKESVADTTPSPRKGIQDSASQRLREHVMHNYPDEDADLLAAAEAEVIKNGKLDALIAGILK